MMRAVFLMRAMLVAVLAMAATLANAQTVLVIGHPGLRKLDAASVLRIYTGRLIEVDGVAVTPLNAPAGTLVRNRFLLSCLQQDEDRYTAYWTVRKYVGKGASPREIGRSAELARMVAATPGAIGYLDESDLPPGANVLFRCPATSFPFLDLPTLRYAAAGLTRSAVAL